LRSILLEGDTQGYSRASNTTTKTTTTTKMDHSHMDHGDMGDMPAMCRMDMHFTWETSNLCIIFNSWHIRTTAGLIFSLLGVALLTAGYEALREASRRYECFAEKQVEDLPRRQQVEVSKKAHVIKALLYGCQVFYSFFIMLLFMTYNGWVMLSVGVGAFIGFLFFGTNTTAAKAATCH